LVFDEFSDEKMVMAWVPINMGGRQWSLVVNVNFQEIASPLKAHSRNVYLGTTCLILVFGAAGFAYYRVDKKKTQFEGYMAVGRVNEQLQLVSTEREEMIAALAKQKELLQSILSAFPYAISWKNTDLVYQSCNNKFAKIVGTDGPESIIGKTDDDLPWKPKQAKAFADRDREVIKTGIGLLNVEQQWHQSNGKTTPMLASHVPLRDSGGRVIGTLGVYMDITELKAAWEEIRAEMNRFSAAIASMDEGIVICGTDGKVLHANPYFANLTNKSSNEIVGNNISETLDQTAAKQVNAIIDDLKKTDTKRTGTVRQTVDDRNFDIRLQGVYVDNKLTAVAINVIDVSSLVNATERAEYAKHTTNKFF
ncbi:MAG: PAS domain-containing protein, partial [Planctomycetes bacterium]|nr:PAS domain-containing protein [Planctomycetota bacterium]